MESVSAETLESRARVGLCRGASEGHADAAFGRRVRYRAR
jgi:hypothetical protein